MARAVLLSLVLLAGGRHLAEAQAHKFVRGAREIGPVPMTPPPPPAQPPKPPQVCVCVWAGRVRVCITLI